jgi:hypothetical protein
LQEKQLHRAISERNAADEVMCLSRVLELAGAPMLFNQSGAAGANNHVYGQSLPFSLSLSICTYKHPSLSVPYEILPLDSLSADSIKL